MTMQISNEPRKRNIISRAQQKIHILKSQRGRKFLSLPSFTYKRNAESHYPFFREDSYRVAKFKRRKTNLLEQRIQECFIRVDDSWVTGQK